MQHSTKSAQGEASASSDSGQAIVPSRSRNRRSVIATLRVQPWLLYGIYLFCVGTLMYVAGILLVIPRYLLGLYTLLTPVSAWLVWYSGLPMVPGPTPALIDLILLFEQNPP